MFFCTHVSVSPIIFYCHGMRLQTEGLASSGLYNSFTTLEELNKFCRLRFSVFIPLKFRNSFSQKRTNYFHFKIHTILKITGIFTFTETIKQMDIYRSTSIFISRSIISASVWMMSDYTEYVQVSSLTLSLWEPWEQKKYVTIFFYPTRISTLDFYRIRPDPQEKTGTTNYLSGLYVSKRTSAWALVFGSSLVGLRKQKVSTPTFICDNNSYDRRKSFNIKFKTYYKSVK